MIRKAFRSVSPTQEAMAKGLRAKCLGEVPHWRGWFDQVWGNMMKRIHSWPKYMYIYIYMGVYVLICTYIYLYVCTCIHIMYIHIIFYVFICTCLCRLVDVWCETGNSG